RTCFTQIRICLPGQFVADPMCAVQFIETLTQSKHRNSLSALSPQIQVEENQLKGMELLPVPSVNSGRHSAVFLYGKQ
ncbi:MAG: hypothetical protein KAT93_05085, partial [Desulfuromonadales bacterium]|nr:hypothetical protein [Desulfuromonadales bacterium]